MASIGASTAVASPNSTPPSTPAVQLVAMTAPNDILLATVPNTVPDGATVVISRIRNGVRTVIGKSRVHKRSKGSRTLDPTRTTSSVWGWGNFYHITYQGKLVARWQTNNKPAYVNSDSPNFFHIPNKQKATYNATVSSARKLPRAMWNTFDGFVYITSHKGSTNGNSTASSHQYGTY